MTKNLLSVGRLGALLLALWLSPAAPAAAQSPWVVGPSTPLNDSNIFFRMFNVQPGGVVWALTRNIIGMCDCESYSVYHTADNGSNWRQRQVSEATYSIRHAGDQVGGAQTIDLFGLDAQTAWILKRAVIGGQISLERTVNGPDGFTVMTAAMPAAGRLFFFSATSGLLFVPGPIIYRTNDAGATWTQVANPGFTMAASDALVNPFTLIGSTLWLSTKQGMVLRTTDAGLTWVSSAPGIPTLNGVTFQNALNGLAYGTDGPRTSAANERLARTTDGGLTWTPVTVQGPYRSRTVVAIPGRPNTYVSCGAYGITYGPISPPGAALSFSTDSGTSWQSINANENLRYLQLAASTDGQLWLAQDPDRPAANYMLLRYAGPAFVTATASPKRAALALYPNPTSGLVQLATPAAGGEEFCLYDMAGRLLQTSRLIRGQHQLDLSGQPRGMYQAVVTTAGIRYTQKLMLTGAN
jgi:hypothetical protein